MFILLVYEAILGGPLRSPALDWAHQPQPQLCYLERFAERAVPVLERAGVIDIGRYHSLT
ncbi:MAG: hypothetical protein QW057_02115 [Candidatus Bathyarchaeia archaeon]